MKLILIFLSLFILAAGCENQPETVVRMLENKYEPENLVIKKGTKVIFLNEFAEPRWPASNLHPTHGIFPEFDPQKQIEPKDSWAFVFNKMGKWKYHDHLVPAIKGTIEVVE